MYVLAPEKIINAIIIPSYRETLALPTLLIELGNKLHAEDSVIIIDDSPGTESKLIEEKCRKSLTNSPCQLIFVSNGIKSGRGKAVRLGFSIALEKFRNLKYVIECDADGSHTAIDIIRLRDSGEKVDLLIGSRYLTESDIQGWPQSRRIFSFLLNYFIPRMLSINISDITNGLRRYSVTALTQILAEPQENSGFIYLSEQALLLKKSNAKIAEIPITFVNRKEGKSTVTIREITQSIQGAKRIIVKNWKAR